MAKSNLSPVATYVEHGYGQVEPNHLSAQRTAQIYAQLPADASYEVLENGQFVKYDYANGVVNKTGKGEWMLVFNEVKLYRDHEDYNDFAMKKSDYVARIYSPMGDVTGYANARNYDGVVNAYEHDITSTTNPFVIEQRGVNTPMKEGTNMVPRVFKTNVGDIFTTNTVAIPTSVEDGKVVEDLSGIAVGKCLAPNADGYLAPVEDTAEGMLWQIAKVYTLADRQRAVKIIRIA
jgi:hypothetical protein